MQKARCPPTCFSLPALSRPLCGPLSLTLSAFLCLSSSLSHITLPLLKHSIRRGRRPVGVVGALRSQLPLQSRSSTSAPTIQNTDTLIPQHFLSAHRRSSLHNILQHPHFPSNFAVNGSSERPGNSTETHADLGRKLREDMAKEENEEAFKNSSPHDSFEQELMAVASAVEKIVRASEDFTGGHGSYTATAVASDYQTDGEHLHSAVILPPVRENEGKKENQGSNEVRTRKRHMETIDQEMGETNDSNIISTPPPVLFLPRLRSSKLVCKDPPELSSHSVHETAIPIQELPGHPALAPNLIQPLCLSPQIIAAPARLPTCLPPASSPQNLPCFHQQENKELDKEQQQLVFNSFFLPPSVQSSSPSKISSKSSRKLENFSPLSTPSLPWAQKHATHPCVQASVDLQPELHTKDETGGIDSLALISTQCLFQDSFDFDAADQVCTSSDPRAVIERNDDTSTISHGEIEFAFGVQLNKEGNGTVLRRPPGEAPIEMVNTHMNEGVAGTARTVIVRSEQRTESLHRSCVEIECQANLQISAFKGPDHVQTPSGIPLCSTNMLFMQHISAEPCIDGGCDQCDDVTQDQYRQGLIADDGGLVVNMGKDWREEQLQGGNLEHILVRKEGQELAMIQEEPKIRKVIPSKESEKHRMLVNQGAMKSTRTSWNSRNPSFDCDAVADAVDLSQAVRTAIPSDGNSISIFSSLHHSKVTAVSHLPSPALPALPASASGAFAHSHPLPCSCVPLSTLASVVNQAPIGKMALQPPSMHSGVSPDRKNNDMENARVRVTAPHLPSIAPTRPSTVTAALMQPYAFHQTSVQNSDSLHLKVLEPQAFEGSHTPCPQNAPQLSALRIAPAQRGLASPNMIPAPNITDAAVSMIPSCVCNEPTGHVANSDAKNNNGILTSPNTLAASTGISSSFIPKDSLITSANAAGAPSFQHFSSLSNAADMTDPTLPAVSPGTGPVVRARSRDLQAWINEPSIINGLKKMGISTLFEWQVECLETGLSPRKGSGNLVYAAPTSAGKSLVAELIMIR